MKLPDDPDALSSQQPHRDRFEVCRLFHVAAHPLMQCLRTRWCPESDLNQRPTAYEAVALPLSYRGDATGKRSPRVPGEVLPCNPVSAKTIRGVAQQHSSRVAEGGDLPSRPPLQARRQV
jgi:hypothetical protein